MITDIEGTTEYHITAIADKGFYWCDSLETIVCPDSLESIGRGAFNSCDALKLVELPDGLRNIGENAFWACQSLEFIELPDGLESIEGGVFRKCKFLRSIKLPDGLKSIGASAFNECYALESVELPASLNRIDIMAFWGCIALKTVTVYSLIPPILGENAFVHCPLQSISIPESSVEDYQNAEGWKDYTAQMEASLHVVTVETDGNGTAAASPAIASQGTKVALTFIPDSGYEFDCWEMVAGEAAVADHTFIMPDEDVIVRASFKKIKADSGGDSSKTVSDSSSEGAIIYGTQEHPYMTGVQGEWVLEYESKSGEERAAWKFQLHDGTMLYSRWAYMDNPYAPEVQAGYDWFLFDERGEMVTGWYYDSKKDSWYYLHDKSDGRLGAMETGWFTAVDGNQYYFDPVTGKMAAGYRNIDGKRYYFREDRSTAENAKLYGAWLDE